MKLKFTRTERAVYAFLLVAAGGTAAATVGLVVKRGLFEPKTSFTATLPSAAGLRVGSEVLFAGLRAGRLERISLTSEGKIDVEFSVRRELAHFVRADSRVRLARPTILGDKVFDLTAGSPASPEAAPGARLAVDGATDIIDLVSGNRVAALLETLDQISANVLEIVSQAGHGHNVQSLVENLRVTSDALRRGLPAFVAKTPRMTEDLSTVVGNLATLTRELARLAPIVAASAQTLPEGSKKTIELLNETVTLVRGMQRSFLFRGGVSDVREEDAAKETGKAREPAARPSR